MFIINKVIFDALNKEAQFTCEMLCTGVTQIRKANYSRRGIYFQAFTSLSTGLERVGKLCLILEHYLKSGGNFPDNKLLKNEIGHDIAAIYRKLIMIKKEYQFELYYLQDLDEDIYRNILDILSRFAKGDRYSNIDLIVNQRNYVDPIETWFENVDLYIFYNKVTRKKREDIENKSKLLDHLIGKNSVVIHTNEQGKDISSIREGSYQMGLYEAVAPYRQLYVFHIIRFFAEMLDFLQSKIMKEFNSCFPYFREIFRVFYNDDKYIKTRKTWEMI